MSLVFNGLSLKVLERIQKTTEYTNLKLRKQSEIRYRGTRTESSNFKDKNAPKYWGRKKHGADGHGTLGKTNSSGMNRVGNPKDAEKSCQKRTKRIGED